jgi:F0F1-type ATP synthase assembly protein I
MSSASYGAWDYVIPISLGAVPVASIILSVWWPFISGVLLIAAGLTVGIPTAVINIWVGAFGKKHEDYNG